MLLDENGAELARSKANSSLILLKCRLERGAESACFKAGLSELPLGRVLVEQAPCKALTPASRANRWRCRCRCFCLFDIPEPRRLLTVALDDSANLFDPDTDVVAVAITDSAMICDRVTKDCVDLLGIPLLSSSVSDVGAGVEFSPLLLAFSGRVEASPIIS